MKTQLFTTIAAAAALLSVTAPAQAATFGTSGINFSSATQVNFSFQQTHGAFQSSLGIFEVGAGNVLTQVATLFSESKGSDNGRANEYLGTLGNTVLGSGKASFTFLANKVYTLGLASTFNGRNQATVYSTTALNRFGGVNTQQAVFGTNLPINGTSTVAFNNGGSYTSANPFGGPVQISFDDRGNRNDVDFQDFTVSAEAVPEPTTMAGMALGAAGLAYARRRRANKQ